MGKREGFAVKKLPSPIAPEKGALSPKIPIFLVVPCREMRIFRLKAPFSGAIGNGSFLTPKPSFPHFGDFDPCRGSLDLQHMCCSVLILVPPFLKTTPNPKPLPWGMFRIFLFFFGSGRGRGRPRREEGGGGRFLLKIPGGGGVLPGEGGGEWLLSVGIFGGGAKRFGGGGAKYFFSAPKFPPSFFLAADV